MASRRKLRVPTVYTKADSPDTEPLYKFEGDFFSHVLLLGQTRSGKSTLLANMVLRYIENGFTVLWREAGKFDFLTRFQCKDDVIDFLKLIGAKQSRIDFWENYDKPIYVLKDDDDLYENCVNIFCYDLYIDSIAGVILQYHELLRKIRLDRERNWSNRNDLVMIIDEANDLMPSANKVQVKGVTMQIRQMVFWMRQWAGYHVRMVLTSHSETQLHKDARDQCGLRLYKRLNRKDAYVTMNTQLYAVNADEYVDCFDKLQKLRYMVSRVLYIDDTNTYTFANVNFVPKKYELSECWGLIADAELKPIIDIIKKDWNFCLSIGRELLAIIQTKNYIDEKGKLQISKNEIRHYLMNLCEESFENQKLEMRILQAFYFAYEKEVGSFIRKTEPSKDEKQETIDRKIMTMTIQKKKQREIAKAVGRSQQYISKRLNFLMK